MVQFAISVPHPDVAAELQRIIDAGTDLVVLHPLYDDLHQMERLAAEVVPLLRAG